MKKAHNQIKRIIIRAFISLYHTMNPQENQEQLLTGDESAAALSFATMLSQEQMPKAEVEMPEEAEEAPEEVALEEEPADDIMEEEEVEEPVEEGPLLKVL